jgi:hypothetical protein
MKRSSRSSGSGFADTAGVNPFAVFEIIAATRKIRRLSSALGAPEIIESANSIERHADGMVKTILGAVDLSTIGVPDNMVEQIVEMLRAYRQ